MEIANLNQKEVTLKDTILIVKEWYIFLLSKYKIILLAAIMGAVLGLGYAYYKKPIYVATLTFALEDEKSSGLGGAMGIAGQLGLDFGGGTGGIFVGANIIELFKSRNMVQKSLLKSVESNGETISFAEMYIRDNNWREKWKKTGKSKDLQFAPNADMNKLSRKQDSVLSIIYENISKDYLQVIQKEKKVSIITLEVKSNNEVFSKKFSEVLTTVVSDFYIETKSKKSFLNMIILKKQLDSIRGELNGSISGVASANDRNFALNPALNIKRVPSVKKNVDVQVNTAILTELVKQTELAKVTLRKETPLLQFIDRPIYPLKVEKVGKIEGAAVSAFFASFFIVVFLIVKRLYDKHIF